jgi:hypothetical protein
MRQLKSLLLVLALTFSSTLMASTNPEDRATESEVITNKIGKMLENPNFEVQDDLTAFVTLTLNKNNELVVLSVDSDNRKMTGYIKSRLNYKKLSESFETLDGKFIVPVRVTSKE